MYTPRGSLSFCTRTMLPASASAMSSAVFRRNSVTVAMVASRGTLYMSPPDSSSDKSNDKLADIQLRGKRRAGDRVPGPPPPDPADPTVDRLLRLRARGLHRVGDPVLEALEVLGEAAGERPRLLVEGGGVGPGVARDQHLLRHAGDAGGHREPEEGHRGGLHPVELAGQGGAHHGPRVGELHPLPHAVRP